MLWTTTQQFLQYPFDKEIELEAAINEIKQDLFGNSRVYLEVKKLIGQTGKTQNIPDGYLLDFSSPKKPVLYIVEVELGYELSAQSSTAEPEVGNTPLIDPSEIDTIVVPARSDGFQEVFIAENRWYAIRIHSSMKPKIRYIAVYQVAPVSAITHMAEVADIEPWKDTEKYCVNFKGPAQKIGPIPLVSGGRVAAPQSIRYTSFARLQNAKSLDDVFLATKSSLVG
jgi:hypothetical protein